MFKFIGGPALGTAMGLRNFGVILASTLGMMTTVLVISYFGIRLRAWYLKRSNRKRKRFTRRNRRIIYVWRRYGEFGVSFLTPVVFSPIIGTLIVTSLGAKRRRVFWYMFISATFWSVAITLLSDLIF